MHVAHLAIHLLLSSLEVQKDDADTAGDLCDP